MFASLRFPGTPVAELSLALPEGYLSELTEKWSLSARQKEALSVYLRRVCSDPEILSYRAEFAAELFSSPELQEVFSDFGTLGDLPGEPPVPSAEGETVRLRTVARFEVFSARFDAFCRRLEGLSPQSRAAQRCFRFLKLYAERFEYKELKGKANELLRAFGFERGAEYALGAPLEEGTARLSRPPEGEGVWDTVAQVLEEFDLAPLPIPDVSSRAYTDTEAAVLTGMIRGDGELARRMDEFFDLYAACGTEDLFRLSEEAAYYTAMNALYQAGNRAGYTVCRPLFREAGFYSEILGLNYPSEEGTPVSSDFITSPLNHVTVVCGPNALSYLQAVRAAHLFASVGGLIFAQSAEVAPVDWIETDTKEQVRTEGLTEHGLCLCAKLFDVMLPRQEEAAVCEVIARLAERNVRSVVRICSKSNLAALEKKIDAKQLPPCTLLQAGNDRTLEDLLQRHRLTAEELEEDGNV